LGTKAVQKDKLAIDPDRKKRRAIYGEVCDLFSDYNVFVGGSSSFDMAPKPFNKYYALDLWCQENGYDHSEVIYVGDSGVDMTFGKAFGAAHTLGAGWGFRSEEELTSCGADLVFCDVSSMADFILERIS
jgi:phosphoglycolate phosphatase-like HAD superfamily hydrolase